MDFSLTEAIKDQSVLDNLSETRLDELIREYPYANWLHVLKAIKKKRAGTLTDEDIHRASIYATDRSKLYDWLEMELPILYKTPVIPEDIEPEVKGEEEEERREETEERKEKTEERKEEEEESEVKEEGAQETEEKTEEPTPEIEGKVLKALVKNGRIDDAEEVIDENEIEEEEKRREEKEMRREEEEGRREEEEGRREEEEGRREEEVEKEETETNNVMADRPEEGDREEAWSFISWLAEHRSSTGDENKRKTEVKEEEKEPETSGKEAPSAKKTDPAFQEEKKETDSKSSGKKKKSGTKKTVSKKSKKKKKKPLKKLIEKSIIQDHDIASEPLADLLASQGHIQQAIEMYERLSLIFPEKSAFFAQKIKKLKKK